MFKLQEKDDLKYFQSDIFDNLKHCFSTRINNNNTHFTLKNNPDNQSTLCEKLDYNFDSIIIPNQTHTDNIAVLTNNKNHNLENTDGIITNLKNTPVMLQFADCTPIILYDEKEKVFGIIHAGWRGTAQNISKKAIEIFINEFNSKPQNIACAIGACISQENYEIDDKTKNKLQKSVDKEYDRVFIPTDDGKFLADLKKLNYYQLKEMGVEKIDISSYCTYSSSDLFFSYRREKENAGRHIAIAQLD